MFTELNEMRLPVQEFKHFDRYFIGDKVCASKKDQVSVSEEVVPSAKSKTKKKSRGDTLAAIYDYIIGCI